MNDKTQLISISEIENRLCIFLRSNIIESKIEVNTSTSFSSLRVDSLSLVEMVLFIERQYKVSIPETELIPENFKSVGTLAACAYRCLQHA